MDDHKKPAIPVPLLPPSRAASAPCLAAGFASEKGILPILITGNLLRCTDMICAKKTFLLVEKSGDELPASAYAGTYALGARGALTIVARDEKTISWESDVDINCIFLKGGPGGNSYSYDLPARSDAGLSTPLDGENGTPYKISHINICYTPPDSGSASRPRTR